MKTKWKKIKGFEELYRVSSKGEVQNVVTGKTLKPIKQTVGNYKVTLQKDKKSYQFVIHTLIADHFIPNPDNLPMITHLDGDKSNNAVTNLKRIGRSELGRLISAGLKKAVKLGHIGDKHPLARLNNDIVRSIKFGHEDLKHREIAELYGISANYVSQIRRGTAWSHIQQDELF